MEEAGPFAMNVLGVKECIRDVLGKTFQQVVTDSRKISKNELFVAIEGETFDGHGFIVPSIEKGATGILLKKEKFQSEWKEKYASTRFYLVDDTTLAYREIARAWRKRLSIPVVAIGGSVGKTTTKEMLAAILAGKFSKVLKTTGSQNGVLGIPMTLLEINETHDIAVVEVGIDEIGTMTGHMDLVAPTAGLLTAIGPEHLEKLIDVPTVAREEGLMMEWFASNGAAAAIRTDDPYIAPHAKRFSKNAITYSLLNSSAFVATSAQSVKHCSGIVSGDALLVEYAGWSKQEKFENPLRGEHNAANLLAAVSMAALLGLSADEIRNGLATFKAAMGRTEIHVVGKGARAPDGLKVICDYYNANPSSMSAALKLLAETKNAAGAAPSKLIACLGDMLELGELEEKYHRDLAVEISNNRVSAVLLYGKRMRWLQDELKKLNHSVVTHFETHQDLATHLLSITSAEDVVLLKGSRGTRMEEVWKLLNSPKS